MQGQFLKWRERRGETKLSDTLYEGILTETPDGQRMLISELSHGLRTFAYKGPEHYAVEYADDPKDLPDDFYRAAFTFYEANQAFQEELPTFHALCSQPK